MDAETPQQLTPLHTPVIDPFTPSKTSGNPAVDDDIIYDSNPFTLSFKGFSLLTEYARSVFITLLVLSIVGFIVQYTGDIVNLFVPDSSSQSQNFDFIDSTQSDTNESVFNLDDESSDDIAQIAAVIGGILLVVIVIFGTVGLLIATAYGGFAAAGAVAASEKRKITVNQALSEMLARFGTLLVANIIVGFKIIGGYLLFIVPGIRAQLRYASVPYIVMRNKDASASQVVARAKELYKGHLVESFGITTVGTLIPFIGGIVNISGMAMSVQQLESYKAQGKDTPRTHWLNYLGFILYGLFLLAIVGIVAIVIALSTNGIGE